MLSRLTFLLPRSIRRHLVLSKLSIDEAMLATVRVKLAETTDEVLGAAHLVHDAYVAKGILSEHGTRLHLITQSAAPHTWTFVARAGDRVVGAGTLTCDGSDGLPMEKVYGRQVHALRERGEWLAEVGSLAIDPEFRKSGLSLLLNRIMLRTALRLGLDRLIIAIHPRGEDFYRETLLFSRLGDECAYPGLNKSARAIAMSLRIPTVEDDLRQAFGHLDPSVRNPYWLNFGTAFRQVEDPEPEVLDASLPVRRALRKAIVRARPDVVRARPSLYSYSEVRIA
jgi:GNAT superfamily N-acetyltransferase